MDFSLLYHSQITTTRSNSVYSCHDYYITLDKHVDVVEDGRSGVHVQNATHKRVADAAECTSVFRQGWLNRTKGQTDFETRATVFFSLDLSMVSELKKSTV